jgi:hypothetical protein
MEMFKLFALELVNDKMGTRFCRLVSIVISRFDELHGHCFRPISAMPFDKGIAD